MIKQIPWCKDAEAGLVISADTDMRIIKNQVLNGIAQLWDINGTGYLVTRIDSEAIGNVFVFVLGEGRGLNEVIPEFIRSAKKLGVNHFRTHVKRKGLIKMWRKHGLSVDHYVLRNTNG